MILNSKFTKLTSLNAPREKLIQNHNISLGNLIVRFYKINLFINLKTKYTTKTAGKLLQT